MTRNDTSLSDVLKSADVGCTSPVNRCISWVTELRLIVPASRGRVCCFTLCAIPADYDLQISIQQQAHDFVFDSRVIVP